MPADLPPSRRLRVLDLFSGLNGWGDPFRDGRARGLRHRHRPALQRRCLPRHRRRGGRPGGRALAAGRHLRLTALQQLQHRVHGQDVAARLASGPQAQRAPSRWPPHRHRGHAPRARPPCGSSRCCSPTYWVIENPRGRLRSLDLLAGIPRRTVWYCRLGLDRAKPTDLWGVFPPGLGLPPECHNGNPDHIAAPRGSRTGTQGGVSTEEAGRIPRELAERFRVALEQSKPKGDP